MIMFERFEAAKIRRFVQRYSKPYLFQRSVSDAFKQPIQPTGALVDVCTIQGVYHEASYSHLGESVSDAGAYVKRITPMIICLKTEDSDKIKIDDQVVVNGKPMAVKKVKDINNCGFAYDISLEYIDNADKA